MAKELKKPNCLDCWHASTDSDMSVGIFPFMEDCSCLDVAVELIEYEFDQAELTKNPDPIPEERLPFRCGHFLLFQYACNHHFEQDSDMPEAVCMICGEGSTNG